MVEVFYWHYYLFKKEKKIIIKNKVYAYDINIALIYVYKNIQTNKVRLYEFIQSYVKEYDEIQGTIINRKPTSIHEAKTSKESYYYWLRNQYNEMDKHLYRMLCIIHVYK